MSVSLVVYDRADAVLVSHRSGSCSGYSAVDVQDLASDEAARSETRKPRALARSAETEGRLIVCNAETRVNTSSAAAPPVLIPQV
jgi:hypothetical protein